jgi:hypothetical protein
LWDCKGSAVLRGWSVSGRCGGREGELDAEGAVSQVYRRIGRGKLMVGKMQDDQTTPCTLFQLLLVRISCVSGVNLIKVTYDITGRYHFCPHKHLMEPHQYFISQKCGSDEIRNRANCKDAYSPLGRERH